MSLSVQHSEEERRKETDKETKKVREQKHKAEKREYLKVGRYRSKKAMTEWDHTGL